MEIIRDTISEAWPSILRYILTTGRNQDVIASGVSRHTIESCDVIMVRILHPMINTVPPNSVFSIPALNAYAQQLMTPDKNEFDYTYGSRLLEYPISDYHLDQIRQIKEELRDDVSSRKALAITWSPEHDLHVPYSSPCLILCDFKIRDGMLNMVSYFRSHDAYGAWPVNAYGLVRLMQSVAVEFAAVGSLTIVSNAAHVYAEDLEAAWRACGRIA